MESYILITKNYCLVLGVITENIGLKKSQNITYQEASKTFVFVCFFFKDCFLFPNYFEKYPLIFAFD